MNESGLSEISKASRRAGLISLAGFAVILASLAYAAFNLRLVEAELERKQAEISRLDELIEERRGENERLLAARNHLLREFGWSEERLSSIGESQVQIEQVVNASQARRTVAIGDVTTSRSRYRILYFAKDVDPERVVVESLAELGFSVSKREPRNPRESNAIWFGRNVPTEEVKLIAFTLLRAGVEVKQIAKFEDDSGRESMVQIGRGMHAYKRTALTVDQIRDAESLDFLAGPLRSTS